MMNNQIIIAVLVGTFLLSIILPSSIQYIKTITRRKVTSTTTEEERRKQDYAVLQWLVWFLGMSMAVILKILGGTLISPGFTIIFGVIALVLIGFGYKYMKRQMQERRDRITENQK